jgi:iron complex transport system substrate-binding protein
VRAVVATLAVGAILASSVWSAALPPAASATRAIVSSSVPPGPFPKTATDTLGNPITLRAPAQRIVSIALSADEILIDLVPPERLVGITKFVDDPGTSPASARAPKTAVRVTGEPEALLALRPDIMFASAYTRPEALSLMTGAGIPVIGSGAHATFDDVLGAVTMIGDAVGEPEKARAVVADARRRIEAVTSRPPAPPVRALIWDGGFTYGRATLEDEILRLAGAVNVAKEAGLEGPTSLTEEAAVALDPEIILVPVESEEAATKNRDLLGGAPIWNAVGAARRGEVFGVPRKWLGCVSHHAVRALEAVAEILDRRRT